MESDYHVFHPTTKFSVLFSDCSETVVNSLVEKLEIKYKNNNSAIPQIPQKRKSNRTKKGVKFSVAQENQAEKKELCREVLGCGAIPRLEGEKVKVQRILERGVAVLPTLFETDFENQPDDALTSKLPPVEVFNVECQNGIKEWICLELFEEFPKEELKGFLQSLLQGTLKQLDNLQGLLSLKESLFKLFYRAKEGRVPLRNYAFLGNPGTGSLLL